MPPPLRHRSQKVQATQLRCCCRSYRSLEHYRVLQAVKRLTMTMMSQRCLRWKLALAMKPRQQAVVCARLRRHHWH